METDRSHRHRLHEDAIALILGTLFVSLGTQIYSQTTLLVGSTAGLALLMSYVTHASFGIIFFVLNLPFYYLAWKRMGKGFTIRTFLAATLVALMTQHQPQWVNFADLNPVYATLVGGGLIGNGLLMLFRHRTGLGGVNILAMYLQDRFNLRAGYIMLGIDAAIMIAAYFVIPIDRLGLSLIGAAITNLIIAINHKPGRYVAWS
ncbi:YitT family protein [Allorhizobium undicola]|uniref:YitT family protein n=1 Tax=Allorhizobium undicola TaxID=78527 RepID=UPI00047FC94A|nr:YitT family protein [Allorhizobium undicola]